MSIVGVRLLVKSITMVYIVCKGLKHHMCITGVVQDAKGQLERPEDLITAEDAERWLVKRTHNYHGWVRDGTITGYRKDPTNKFSTLMVTLAMNYRCIL